MISIITPVYNAAEYIGRYLESVMSQTYTDIEVILVDDHCPCDTIGLARKITDGYDGPIRFRYLKTEANSGPGVARNLGIAHAKGEYIAFMDCDDSIGPDFCRLLLESAEKNRSDLCCCHASVLNESGKQLSVGRNPYVADGDFSGESRRAFLSTYVSYFSTFLYRTDFIRSNHICFADGRSSEDSVMLCLALLCCRRISQVDGALYHYFKRPGSLSTAKNPTRYQQKLASLRQLMETVRAEGLYESDEEEIDFIYFKKGYLVSVFNYIANSDRPELSVVKSIRQELESLVPDYRSSRYLRFVNLFSIVDFLLRKCPSLAIPLIRIYLLGHRDIML